MNHMIVGKQPNTMIFSLNLIIFSNDCVNDIAVIFFYDQS